MSTPFIGEIRIFGFHFAPAGWAFCSGQLLPIQQYAALFSILGTTFGGNGTTTFALPNFQDTAPMHWGNGPGLTPRVLGETVGSASVALTTAQMPSHTHGVQGASALAAAQSTATPGPTVFPGQSNPGQAYLAAPTTLTAQFSNKAIGLNGGGTPHPNAQPLLGLNICIALQGLFPSRN